MSGAKTLAGETVRLTIEGLGGLGDGIARHQGVTVYVPLAAPGDLADVLIGPRRGDGVSGQLISVLESGAARRAPPCPYFGACGGCALQHIGSDVYASWKAGLVGEALARLGLASDNRPMRAPAPDDATARRRRAVFAAERLPRACARGAHDDAGVTVGFNARATRRIVAVDHCLLLTPALNRLIEPVAGLMQAALGAGERGQAVLTDLGGVVDILIVGDAAPSRRARERIADFAEAARPDRGAILNARGDSPARVARVSWRAVKDEGGVPEPLVEHAPCRVELAGTAVDFPPGGFLQPSVWGEATLQRLVTEGAGEAARIADLFAGLGTFAFALASAWGRPSFARRSGLREGGEAPWKILAFERDPALANALDRAARRSGLAGKLAVETRDLDRRPLLADELGAFDTVVLDPPRTGARAQCQALAQKSPGPTRAVMVSCNPATFARDARILQGGGWRLDQVTPVDQFHYSAHLELVAVFTRPTPGRKQTRPRRGFS